MMKQFSPDKVKNDLLYLQVETFRKSMNFAKDHNFSYSVFKLPDFQKLSFNRFMYSFFCSKEE